MIRKAVLALSLATVVAACHKTPDPPASVIQPPGLGDRVRVLSADAFVIDGRHVRLANAYAPQGVPDARCWAEASAAKLANDWVRGKVHEARAVTVEATGGVDEYHRDLAHVSLDGVDLGQALFEAGLAGRRTDAPNGRFSWCEPISGRATGAPVVGTLLDNGVR